MKILEITNQHRRDFTATMQCQHCNHIQAGVSGYDDKNFHENVIPDMDCPKCKKKGGDYRPLAPKYGANEVV